MPVWSIHTPAQAVAPTYCSRPINALKQAATNHASAALRKMVSRLASVNEMMSNARATQNQEETNGTTAGVGPGEKGLSHGARTSAKMKNRATCDEALSGSIGGKCASSAMAIYYLRRPFAPRAWTLRWIDGAHREAHVFASPTDRQWPTSLMTHMLMAKTRKPV